MLCVSSCVRIEPNRLNRSKAPPSPSCTASLRDSLVTADCAKRSRCLDSNWLLEEHQEAYRCIVDVPELSVSLLAPNWTMLHLAESIAGATTLRWPWQSFPRSSQRSAAAAELPRSIDAPFLAIVVVSCHPKTSTQNYIWSNGSSCTVLLQRSHERNRKHYNRRMIHS